MFALFLTAVFAVAAFATIASLADSGLRWWSAFDMLRKRRKQGYATAGVGQRPAFINEGSLGFARSPRAYPIIRQTTQRAA